MEHDFKLLIAEDDEVNFFLLNLWLKDTCSIMHAKNGKEAVQLANENPDINLIIMDVRMPYMSGTEATELIRKTNSQVPIIAHTAYAVNEEQQLIYDVGCTDILPKPARKNECLALVNKYMNE